MLMPTKKERSKRLVILVTNLYSFILISLKVAKRKQSNDSYRGLNDSQDPRPFSRRRFCSFRRNIAPIPEAYQHSPILPVKSLSSRWEWARLVLLRLWDLTGNRIEIRSLHRHLSKAKSQTMLHFIQRLPTSQHHWLLIRARSRWNQPDCIN